MPAQKTYSDELKQRAVRMVFQIQRESGKDKGAVAGVAAKLGINRETLRSWVLQSQVDAGVRPPRSTEDAQLIAELERENSELRRAQFAGRECFSPGNSAHDRRGSRTMCKYRDQFG